MRTQHEEMAVKFDFSSFPEKYTCSGEDISPRISISGLSHPYLALILDDPDAPSGTFTHWLIWNIGATDTIPEDISRKARPEELPGSVQGANSAGSLGYSGPCPPRGKPHHYHLKAYGLDAPLNLEPGATKRDLERALESNAKQHSDFVATFQR